MNIEDKIQRVETNLQRKLDWIGRHDGRTTFVTGIIIAMLGVLTSASSKIEIWTWFTCISIGVTAILLFISLFFIFTSQYPKTKSQNTSLICFGTVAEMRFDEFKRQTLSTTDQDYLEDVLCQIHINAQILQSKFSALKTSLILLAIANISWFISIYVSHEFIE
jgi:hypothetical protein